MDVPGLIIVSVRWGNKSYGQRLLTQETSACLWKSPTCLRSVVELLGIGDGQTKIDEREE